MDNNTCKWTMLIGAVGVVSVMVASCCAAHQDCHLNDEPNEGVSVSPSTNDFNEVDALLNTNYILVSTMDGKLTALDANSHGEVVWSSHTDGSPLLSGSLHSRQLMADGHPYLLVPSLDGSLFMFNMDSNALNPIPVNTDVSVMIGDDAVAGGTVVSTTGLDPITGHVRYHCNADSCDQTSTDSRSSFTLVLRKNTQMARAADPLTGQERWNLSVGEYSLSLASSGSVQQHLYHQSTAPSTRFRLRPPDGIVSAVNNDGQEMWQTDLNSPIAGVWQLVNAHIHQISMFDVANVESAEDPIEHEDASPLEAPFYFGTVNSEPYIIPSSSSRADLRRLASGPEVTRFKPYGTDLAQYGRALFLHDIALATMMRGVHDRREGEVSTYHSPPSSCPTVNRPVLSDSTQLQRVGLGNELRAGDLGWFVFKTLDRRRRAVHASSSTERLIADAATHRTNIIQRFGDKLNVDQPVSGWWRVGAVAMCVLLSMTTVLLIYRQRFRNIAHQHSDTPPSPLASSRPSRTSWTEKQSAVSLDKSKQSTNLSTSTNASHSPTDSFSSKFVEDFIPEKVLGKGGYGVVFNCRHRLDDRSYAVKRIAVSDSESAIERVRREARAMAKLDHAGIIRYFHTWIERPPQGWQQAQDKQTLNAIRMSSGCSLNSSISRDSNDVFQLSPDREPSTKSEDSLAKQCPLRWKAKGDVAPSQSTGSWADGDDAQGDGDATACSSSDSDSISPVQRPQTLGVETESSGVVFEAGSEPETTARDRHHTTSTSSGPLEPPAVLMVSETELHTCKRTKHYIYLYIQMELCQELTLHNWLLENNRAQDRVLATMRNWLAQLVQAISYIHDQGLIHRDLKPQNIFFSADGLNTLKIGDLGLATIEETVRAETDDTHSQDATQMHTGNVGTRLYMSPEQLRSGVYDQKIDVFAMGLIFAEMLIPFQTVMERHKTLSQLQIGVQPNAYLSHLPAEMELISWLTEMDASNRPTCRELISSEYLQSEMTLIGIHSPHSFSNPTLATHN